MPGEIISDVHKNFTFGRSVVSAHVKRNPRCFTAGKFLHQKHEYTWTPLKNDIQQTKEQVFHLLRFFEIAFVLVHFDQRTGCIVNPNHSIV